jgi:hypothetical protein
MAIDVSPVVTRAQKRAFLELPWTLYQNVPAWMPPIRQNAKELAGFAKHPFHAENKTQTFLATRGGQTVGRIMSIVNHAHNQQHNENRGFFGFFESIDDVEVSTKLFDAVRDWLTAQGIRSMRGPTNPSLNYEGGFLVEGFDKAPAFMMPYSLPYYPKLAEAYGFTKSQDMYAFWGSVDMLDKLDKKLLFVATESKERFGINLRPMSRKHFRRDIELFLDLYNISLGGTWGFAPMSKAEVRHAALGLKHLIWPEMTLIAEAEGRSIGAVLCLPDYNPRVKAINGRLFPFGFLKLLSRKPPFKRVRVMSANVLPEFQKWGVGLVLVQGLLKPVLDSGVQEGEFSWVLESNHLSRKSLERGGAKLEKTYRIYDKDFS